jgi:hypothetical protein
MVHSEQSLRTVIASSYVPFFAAHCAFFDMGELRPFFICGDSPRAPCLLNIFNIGPVDDRVSSRQDRLRKCVERLVRYGCDRV